MCAVFLLRYWHIFSSRKAPEPHSSMAPQSTPILSVTQAIALDAAMSLIGPLCEPCISLKVSSSPSGLVELHLTYEFHSPVANFCGTLCTINLVQPLSLRNIAQDVFLAWLGNRRLWGEKGYVLHKQWVKLNEAAVARGEEVELACMPLDYASTSRLPCVDLCLGDRRLFYTAMLDGYASLHASHALWADASQSTSLPIAARNGDMYSAICHACVVMAGDDCCITLRAESHMICGEHKDRYAIIVVRGDERYTLSACPALKPCALMLLTCDMYWQLAPHEGQSACPDSNLLRDCWWRLYSHLTAEHRPYTALGLTRESTISHAVCSRLPSDPFKFYMGVRDALDTKQSTLGTTVRCAGAVKP